MTRAAIAKAYGFSFPPDLERFWAIAKKHADALFDAGIRLAGPLVLLAQGKLDAELGRWPGDPPELFTVLEGDTDGLHWGYVLHEPGTSGGYVGSFYARDGYPIAFAGSTLIHAMHEHIGAIAGEMQDELDRIRDVGEDDGAIAKSVRRLEALAAALGKARGKTIRPPKERVASLDGLGIRAPKKAFVTIDGAKLARDLQKPTPRAAWIAKGHALVADGKPGAALQIARDALAVLATKEQDAAVLLAIAAYEALGRPLLARTFASRRKAIEKRTKRPIAAPPIDNRVSHSMEEALAAPEKVEHLILEQWRSQPKTPDLDAITRCKNLRSLTLRGYPLGDLPPSFARLGKLTSIELFECKLTTVPKVLTKLPKLDELEIVQDSGGRTPRKAIAMPRGLAFRKLTSLSLGGCGLAEIPPFVFDCTRLYKLSLGGNRLTKLPDTIARLGRLQYLYLGENKLTALPPAIGRLKKLSSLWLRKNAITTLPDAIAALALESVDLADNPLVKSKDERARAKKLLRKAKIYFA